MQRWSGRVIAAIVGVFAALVVAAAAFAHVEVTAEPAIGGAANAVLTFSAEAESPSAGIASVRIVLPAGIAPADVKLDKAPTGWTFTPGADGYTVGGPALKKGMNAEHSVIVAHLPNVPELMFKALVTYSDGSVDRWIEETTSANPSPENPAPVLKLAVTTPTPAATTAVPATTPAPTASPAAAPASGGGSSWLWWLIGIVIVLAAAGAFFVMRGRRTP